MVPPPWSPANYSFLHSCLQSDQNPTPVVSSEMQQLYSGQILKRLRHALSIFAHIK